LNKKWSLKNPMGYFLRKNIGWTLKKSFFFNLDVIFDFLIFYFSKNNQIRLLFSNKTSTSIMIFLTLW
jgi:hypothetical protein